MPEGPEVKKLVDWLNLKIKNKKLTSIKIISGRYKKHQIPKNYNNFISKLPLQIKSVACKGKFIYFQFNNSDLTIWNTLGMTGWWEEVKHKHNHIIFNFGEKKLYFNDMRNFGTFTFCLHPWKFKMEQK